MGSGIKFSFYILSAILFISGLNSLINGERNEELALLLIPLLCLGSGICIPLLMLIYEACFSNSHTDSNEAPDQTNTEAQSGENASAGND